MLNEHLLAYLMFSLLLFFTFAVACDMRRIQFLRLSQSVACRLTILMPLIYWQRSQAWALLIAAHTLNALSSEIIIGSV
jgi:hypothetical protein